MGWTNRTRQTKTKKKNKLIRKRVVALILLVATLTLFSINKVGTPFKSPTPEPTKATMEEKKANKVLAKKIAWLGYGWKDKEWVCLDNLFIKESKYDNFGKNKAGSKAFGIGQLIGETSTDPTVQLLKTYKYIQHRYKTPCSAWRWHLHHNWY